MAAPFGDDDELAKKSLNFSPDVVDSAYRWLRARRATMRRPTLSFLVDAALTNLPTDIEELRELAKLVPADSFDQGPVQLGLRIRAATVARVEDAQFETTATRGRTVPLWHSLSGALAAQLAAEGFAIEGQPAPEGSEGQDKDLVAPD